MNSALKPVLTTSGPQNSQVSSQLNKPMHPQGSPATYGQPPSHMPQSLVNIPHNPNVAHNHPPNTGQNHYSLNVPNSSQHYIGNSAIPPSNHPVANVNQPSGQVYNAPKTTPYSGGYQPNLGHPPNQSSLPPVSQTLPATTQSQQLPSQTSAPSAETVADKPQSNGTPEVKTPTKTETPQGNHISPAKEKPPSPTPSPIPQVTQLTEKSAEKPKTSVPTTPEQKPPQATLEPAKIPEEASVVPAPLPTPLNSESVTSTVASSTTETQSEKTDDLKEISSEKAETAEQDSIAEIDSSESNSSTSEKDATTAVPGEAAATADCAAASTTQPKPKEPSPVQKPATKPAVTTATTTSTTPRTPTRKSKTPKPEETPKKSEQKALTPKLTTTGKIKRQRTRTQPYQSPLPELEIISKISSSTPRSKNPDDKLIVFYKNEFLAVRNSEGTFYVCQSLQNVYKSSNKIKIRWLSQDKDDKTGEIYTPDFYDLTDFDCILTNLNLSRVDKGKYRLPKSEKERTDSILSRSLAAEKGEKSRQDSLSLEHPDGLDISLYLEESQLNKKQKGTKRKAARDLKSDKVASNKKKSPDQAKVQKVVVKATKKKVVKKVIAAKPAVTSTETKKVASTSSSRAGRAKRRSENIKTSPVVDQKKARVLAKVARKTAISVAKTKPPPPTKSTTKVSKPVPTPSSSKAVSTAKSSAVAPKVVATRKTKRSTRK